MSTLSIDAASAGMNQLAAAQSNVKASLDKMLGQSKRPAVSQTAVRSNAGAIEAADAAKIVGNQRDDADMNEGPSDTDMAKASASYSRGKVLEKSSLASLMIGRQSSVQQAFALLSASAKSIR